jgi:hypothetical protein
MRNQIPGSLLVCTLCALALAAGSASRAEEESVIPAAPIKAALAPVGYRGPVEYEAKVMVVNRAERTLTVDINGKLHLFKMNSQVRFLKKGKPISLNDVAAGQKVSLVATKTDSGALNLASVAVDVQWIESEPAGRTENARGPGGASYPSNPSRGKVPPPFQNGHYPGHVERVVVSPHN